MLSNKQIKLINKILSYYMMISNNSHFYNLDRNYEIVHIFKKYNISTKDLEEYILKDIDKYNKVFLYSFCLLNKNITILKYLLKDKSKSPLKRKIDLLIKKDFNIDLYTEDILKEIFSFENLNNTLFSEENGDNSTLYSRSSGNIVSISFYSTNYHRKNNQEFYNLLINYNLLEIKNTTNCFLFYSHFNNLELLKKFNIKKMKQQKENDLNLLRYLIDVLYLAVSYKHLNILKYLIELNLIYIFKNDIKKLFFDLLKNIVLSRDIVKAQSDCDFIIDFMLENKYLSIDDLLEYIDTMSLQFMQGFINTIISNHKISENLNQNKYLDLLNKFLKYSTESDKELIIERFSILKQQPIKLENLFFYNSSELNISLNFNNDNLLNTNLIAIYFNQSKAFIEQSLIDSALTDKQLKKKFYDLMREFRINSSNLENFKILIDNKSYFKINKIDKNTYIVIILIGILKKNDIHLLKKSFDIFNSFDDFEEDYFFEAFDENLNYFHKYFITNNENYIDFNIYSFFREKNKQFILENNILERLYDIHQKMKNRPHFEVLSDEDYDFIFDNLKENSYYIINFLTKSSFVPLIEKYQLSHFVYFVQQDTFKFNNAEELKQINLQKMINKFLIIKKEFDIDFNTFNNFTTAIIDFIYYNLLFNENGFKNIINFSKIININTNSDCHVSFKEQGRVCSVSFMEQGIKPLLKWIENNFITFELDIFNSLKIILDNYNELIEKNIPIINWISYCNIKGLKDIQEKLPEALDTILSSGINSIQVNISKMQVEFYISLINNDMKKYIDNLELPFYKNIFYDKETSDYLLYEMLPGFDPKSLLVNHALDCCLVAGGASENILPYMTKNSETCGMFVISKIHNTEIINSLKEKIKEINNIINIIPLDIEKYNLINEEIKLMLVDRENLKSNITILGTSFTYIKNNILVFDNIETNNKTFRVDEKGNNIRYNTTSVPFMKCYAEYSKIAMQYNENITYNI